jgi:putative transposase
MYKTFEYRPFTNRSQHTRLLSTLSQSRLLYNEMLELVKAHYEETGEFLNRYALTSRFKGRGGEHVPQTTVQTLADRLHKALKRFLRRKEFGRKVGFPRFKNANRWHSIQLRQYGRGRDVFLNSETKRLHVPSKLGRRLKVKQHRPLQGTPRPPISSSKPMGIGTSSSSATLVRRHKSARAMRSDWTWDSRTSLQTPTAARSRTHAA